MGAAKRFKDKNNNKIVRFCYLLKLISKIYSNDQIYSFAIKQYSGKRKKR
jgi:hypothetical protein